MSRNLSLADHTALTYLFTGNRTATHWVARACGFTSDRATAQARTMLRRLQRWGLVGGVSASRSGNVYWWTITDAGREAVQP
ncbi:hypothetical protein C1T17_16285 [Sphingobium sp. SCG-1]|uniref:hypothetical protein n=1 Tax=Sphingobium sp. SCG-1 TaxID=2072936 RepID=UPI000CD69334|nr:hypothetical protein [Sphingobium sp. SCG-1]AUW59412.1 hypothetical protein C1T17_16285 [Sphingobium sp. SCG-1]